MERRIFPICQKSFQLMISFPLVSVVVPVFNTEKYVKFTIDSVKSQTYPNWELILVDDCSTDQSVSIIELESKSEPRIRLVRNTVNSGALATRNRGIAEANGKYLCFLDSDDTFEPEKIKTQVEFMVNGDYALSFTMFKRITESGHFLGGSNVSFVPSIDYKGLLGNPQFSIITLMIDREKVNVPLLDYSLVKAEDYVFHLSLLKQGFQAYGINTPLSNYRYRPGSQSTSFFGNASDLWKVLYHLERLGLFRSVFYFSRYLKNGIKKRLVLASQLSSTN